MDYFQTSQNPNVRRILDAIAQAEGTTKYGYNTLFGGDKFDDLSTHPNQLKPFTQTDGKKNYSSAAGKYQFINPTWQDVSKQLGLKDFGPESQDAAAVYLIERAGALDDVLNGDFKAATDKLGGTWASLPSSNYAQPKKTEEEWMAMLNNGQQEPGMVESIVNTVIPTANAAESPSVFEEANEKAMQDWQDLKNIDKADLDINVLSGEALDKYFKKDGKEIDPLKDLMQPAPMNAQEAIANTLPMALQSLLGPRGAGELRSQDLNLTNPALANSMSNMNSNMGSMLPLALGASMSNDVGARNMGKSLLPLAMQSMVPTDVGEGLILPDGTYVTDEPMATPSSSSGKQDNGYRINPSASERVASLLDTTNLMGELASTVGDDYGGYYANFIGDTAKELQDRFGYDGFGGMSREELNWWRNYQRFINQVRNELYGSALTKPEAQAFEKSIATVKSQPGSLQDSLNSQFKLLERAVRRRTQMLGDGGYDVAGWQRQLDDLRKNYPSLYEEQNNKKSSSNSESSSAVDDAMKKARSLKNG